MRGRFVRDVFGERSGILGVLSGHFSGSMDLAGIDWIRGENGSVRRSEEIAASHDEGATNGGKSSELAEEISRPALPNENRVPPSFNSEQTDNDNLSVRAATPRSGVA